MTVTILTLVIGADYRKSLEKALESKRAYAAKHGYTYIQCGEESWDRTRPISWSKVPLLLKTLETLPEGALVWMSDADVLITNVEHTIERHVLPLLPDNKDLLLVNDACQHLNGGNILMRNSPWCRDFWLRVNERSDCTYHIWWESMAIIRILEENKSDSEKVEITNQHKRINAYVMGLPGEPLWEKGDFLVHFAGVYKPERMEALIDEIQSGKTPRLDMYTTLPLSS